MPHNRSPRPGSKWFLPKAQYRAVVSFCYCYGEYKKRLSELLIEIAAAERLEPSVQAYVMDGMPHGTDISDPTASEALGAVQSVIRMRREADRLRAKTSLIETVTQQECGDLYPWIFKWITEEGVTTEHLRANGMPIERHLASEFRRRVYYNIARRM